MVGVNKAGFWVNDGMNMLSDSLVLQLVVGMALLNTF